MKCFRYLTVFLITGVGLISCKKDFLDVESTQHLFRQSYVKDLNSMQQFVNGLYVTLASTIDEGVGASYPEVISDNLMPITNSVNALTAHYTWQQKASDASNLVLFRTSVNMNSLWISGYRAIRACNFVIDETNQYVSENPTKANYIMGQAHAVRAYLYFKLINTFAQGYKFTADASHPGVPFITTADITDSYSKNTVAEVYAGMISDLNNAIQSLPAETSDTRYMNRNTAKALLARIYLFKEDYANAKSLATEVANDVPLMSINNGYPDAVYKLKSPHETETLFQLSPKYEGYYTDFLSVYFRRPSRRSFVATNDLGEILKENPNDVRSNWVTDNAGKWYVTKFPMNAATEVPGLLWPERSYYHCVIRSSEMHLTVAEASAKSGDENTARSYLNSIRKRADPSLVDVNATGAALIDSIYKERRKELVFEGLRMFDLQRWKMAVHRSTTVFPNSSDLPYPSSKSIAPVPLNDVNLAGIQQSPGY